MSASHDADAGKLCSIATVIVQCVLFADWPKKKVKLRFTGMSLAQQVFEACNDSRFHLRPPVVQLERQIDQTS